MFRVSVIWQPLEPDTSEEEPTSNEIADFLSKNNTDSCESVFTALKASEVTASARLMGRGSRSKQIYCLVKTSS